MMQLFVNCFYACIFLWCLKTGHAASNSVNTTDAPNVENKTMSTVKLNETTKDMLNTKSNSFDIENMNFTETSPSYIDDKSAKIRSQTDVTTSKFENSTDDEENDTNNAESGFNIALIPAAAVFILVVIICFKCCKWFRKYTKGDDKDVKYYAVILTDDDEGHVNIDTISSNTSLLTKSDKTDKEDIMESYRNSLKGNKNKLPPPIRSVGDQAVMYDKRLSKSSLSNDRKEFAYNPIVSSVKRNAKLSVSFSEASELSDFELSDFVGMTKQPNNVRCSVRKSTTDQSDVSSTKSSPVKAVTEKMMTNVGTQTNKSFRSSLRMSKVHMSESDIERRNTRKLRMPSLMIDAQKCQARDGTDSDTSKTVGASEFNKLATHSDSIPVKDTHSCKANLSQISKYPIDTNVEVKENIGETKVAIEIDSDLFDDVFDDDVKERNSPQNADDMRLSSRPFLNTLKNDQTGRVDHVNGSFAQTSTFLCNICNANLRKDIEENICDTDGLCLHDDIPTTRVLCNGCKLLNMKEKTELCETANSEANERTLTSQCHDTKVNDRPASSSSLESSGYAELSSSEYSSGSH
ncbi:uncharacterized protein LOC132723334 [Ruditapes philippinarum]|uniref:uncharacterized protein LOC132723334 n=1 Tax=Ruditapes philippinarum TaxID=129788 RepID=UPI00295A62C2|nr:uncharacterized protein LOC132723334 [Ruditapes philippinarum]XP_060564016.1 uncharacterized protein LOC132723334 [Ruditapes philippinarum]